MRRRKPHPGFTLIEMVLVLAIIATVAMIAAPSLGGFAKGRALPNAAAEFVAVTRFCRVRAMQEGLVYRVNLDAQAGKWWVTKDDGTTGLVFVPVTDDEVAREYVLPANVTMTTTAKVADGECFIAFDPGGRCDVEAVRLESGTNWVNIGVETAMSTYKVVPERQGVQ